nr:MAG: hypothetical protein DIU57_19195 [Pseudomonadota bacterium]
MSLKRLEIHIQGPHVRPDQVPVRHLFSFLDRYEKLLKELACPDGKPGPDLYLRLTGVKEGSLCIECVAPDELQTANKTLSEIVKGSAPPPPNAVRSLNDLQRMVEKRGWKVEFTGDEIGTLSIPGEKRLTPTCIEGETTLYGECIQVGGKEARLKLSGYKGKTLTIEISKELAKEIGRHLYEEIGVCGKGKWDFNTGTLLTFRADKLLPYRKTPLDSAIEALQKTAGPDWAKIDDIDKFLRSLWCE